MTPDSLKEADDTHPLLIEPQVYSSSYRAVLDLQSPGSIDMGKNERF